MSIVKDSFSLLRSDFEDQKKVCDSFEFKEKQLLEEIDRQNATRAIDLEELLILMIDSQKTKNQLAASQKALEEENAKTNALTQSFQKKPGSKQKAIGTQV